MSNRLCHYMGPAGHFTFAWEPSDDVQARNIIQRKMDEGVVFRIIEHGPFGNSRPRRLVSMTEVPESRKLTVTDADVELFLSHNMGRVVETAPEDETDEDVAPMRRATTPDEVLANDTVAHRPLRGG